MRWVYQVTSVRLATWDELRAANLNTDVRRYIASLSAVVGALQNQLQPIPPVLDYMVEVHPHVGDRYQLTFCFLESADGASGG